MRLSNSVELKRPLLWIALLLVMVIILSFLKLPSADEENVSIWSEANTFYKPLPEQFESQVNATESIDSSYAYSVQAYEDPTERELVLINKNPSRRAFLNRLEVRVYAKNIERYKNEPNYKAGGFLDYTSLRKPIMHSNDSANYSVLKVTLPQIDIKKIYIYQPGIFKTTLEQPFQNLPDVTVNTEVEPTLQELYQPLLNTLLKRYDIQRLKENDAFDIDIKASERFWEAVNSKDSILNNYMTIAATHKDIIDQRFSGYLEGTYIFNKIFDVEKLAGYFAIRNLFTETSRNSPIKLSYNTTSQKLEPVFPNTVNTGALNDYAKNEHIDNTSFLDAYGAKLETLGHLDIDALIEDTPGFSERIRAFNSLKPSVLFEKRRLEHNKLVLLNGAKPSTGIKAEFLNLKDKELKVVVTNLSNFSLTVANIKYEDKAIANIGKNATVAPNKKDTVSFKLPRSFQNLFVHKKSKTAGFIFEKDIFDFSLGYISGKNINVQTTTLVPYQPIVNYNKETDLFRGEPNLEGFDFLEINESSKTITLKSTVLCKPLILPEGYTIRIKPGTTIDIAEGGKIISYSPLQWVGTKNYPINIISTDKKGQGLLVTNAKNESQLKHVNFDGLTNPQHGLWSTTSAITFYESPVNFDYTMFSNNRSEDALNVVRTSFLLLNSSFKNTQSDAFDGDFVTGNIVSCTFNTLGNDAIDVSGSDLEIINVNIAYAGDKGLSAGEDSVMKASKVKIRNSAIGVAGKDLSIVTLEDVEITDTSLGFTAFKKKPEFGESHITASEIILNGVETDYLIEVGSSLLLNGEQAKTTSGVKGRMYGVEFGRSSSETRKKEPL